MQKAERDAAVFGSDARFLISAFFQQSVLGVNNRLIPKIAMRWRSNQINTWLVFRKNMYPCCLMQNTQIRQSIPNFFCSNLYAGYGSIFAKCKTKGRTRRGSFMPEARFRIRTKGGFYCSFKRLSIQQRDRHKGNFKTDSISASQKLRYGK